jgi:inner membrane protein
MPSPIAHSITGYVLSRFLPLRDQRLPITLNRRLKLFSAIAIANIADFDFLAQMIGIGQHRGITHSLTAVIGFSLGLSLLSYWRWRPVARHILVFALVIYGSHLLLDAVTAGGPGMQLLAPFSDRYFQADTLIFPPVHHSEGLLYRGHWEFIRFELAYSVVLLGLTWVGERLMRRHRKLNRSRLSRLNNMESANKP